MNNCWVTTVKPSLSFEDWEIVTDELTEVLADLDAKINPNTHPEAYNCMHERVLTIQKILLRGTEWNREVES